MPFEGSFAGRGPRLAGEAAYSLPMPGLVPGPPGGSAPPPQSLWPFPWGPLQTSSSDSPEGERTKMLFLGPI